jgi:hypothetical protein
MNAFGQNLRYCLRALRKRPGYTLIIVITLALGIGANIDGFYLFNVNRCAMRCGQFQSNASTRKIMARSMQAL